MPRRYDTDLMYARAKTIWDAAATTRPPLLAQVRCAHPFCRTSLTEDSAVQCPHALTFCEHCTWEEACAECDA